MLIMTRPQVAMERNWNRVVDQSSTLVHDPSCAFK